MTLASYSTNSNIKKSINETAKFHLDAQMVDLQALAALRSKLAYELNELNLAATDRGVGALTRVGRDAYRKKIDDISNVIVAQVATLPFGYEPEIARAYVEMATRGSFDETVLKRAFSAAQQRYQSALNFYTTHKQPTENGNVLFCLDEDYRQKAYKSGGVTNALNAVIGKNSRPKFKEKLNCRLKATYDVGAKRWSYISNGALIAGFVFSAPEMLAASGVSEILEVKGVQTVAELAATDVATAGVQTVFLTSAISKIHEGCFKEDFELSTSGEATCDPSKDFQNTKDTSTPLNCAIALGMNGAYYTKVAFNLLQEARAAVVAARATSNAANAARSEAESVAAANRLEVIKRNAANSTTVRSARFSMAAEDAKFMEQHHVSFNKERYLRDGVFEFLSDKNGNEFNRLAYKYEQNFHRKILVDPKLKALGQAEDEVITINAKYLVESPELAKGTLLHEIDHVSHNTMKTGVTLWRRISITSDNGIIPAKGYEHFMRTDEVEARLAQINKLMLDNTSVSLARAKEITEAAQQMVETQRLLFSSMINKESGALAAHKELKIVDEYANTKKIQLTETYGDQSIKATFTIMENSDAKTEIERQIAERLKFLGETKSKLQKKKLTLITKISELPAH